MLKSLDKLHEQNSFFGVCFPWQTILANGVFGATPGHPVMRKCIDLIKKHTAEFTRLNGNLSDAAIQALTGPQLITECLFEFLHEQPFSKVLILPAGYFFPFPVTKRNAYWKGQLSENECVAMHARPESFAMHMWANSWVNVFRAGDLRHSPFTNHHQYNELVVNYSNTIKSAWTAFQLSRPIFAEFI